jgi:cation-transporting P-type ATPase F
MSENLFFTQPLEKIAQELDVNLQVGLSDDEAQRRLRTDGENRLTAKRGVPAWRKLLEQFLEPLVVILILAAVVSILLGDTADAAVIAGVVLVNSVIGFLQEYRAEKAIAALDALVVTEASVLRDGEQKRIPSSQLARGDIVVLTSGDAVPADLRLMSTRDLHIEEAALTGESVPVSKSTDILKPNTVLGDRTNMAFAGTSVTYGRGCGVVVSIGDDTETGRIAGLLARAQDLKTPLTRRIATLSQLLVWVILLVAGALFAIEALRGSDLSDTFNAAVALAVGAIPEGLPAAVTVLLAVGVQTLAKRRALIRKLPAVETLGSTTVICSDKTGTLTENEMTVTHIWTQEGDFLVTGVGYSPEGEFFRSDERVDPHSHPALLACLRIGALCNDTRIVRLDHETKIEGDPTEAALTVACQKACASERAQELLEIDTWDRTAEIPFESENMFMATAHRGPGGLLMSVKGSSEVLLERCTSALDGTGCAAPLDRTLIDSQVAQLAQNGLRVLCLAQRLLSVETKELTQDQVADLTFVGLMGMIDPPRESARRAIEACHRAGIKVKMITGDHAITASAIAEQLGLRGALDQVGSLRTVTGRDLEQVSPREFEELAEEIAVFARVAPEQKLSLVRSLQKRNHVVAMTGDGVNDAPALKQADLGIAMGKGGTDVARGASAMILTDDNFETIVSAVEEGRGIYDNLVKFITWTLPTNGGEALVLLAAVVLGVSLPVLPVQILWVNMATALLLGIALVFEPKEPGLMDRPPRPVNAKLMDGALGLRTIVVSVLVAGAAFGLFKWSIAGFGLSVAQARTIAVNTIVVVEVGYLFACRSPHLPIWKLPLFENRWIWLGSSLMLLAQLAFTYLPVFNQLFHTSPIDWFWWAYFTLAGVAVLLLVEVYKWSARTFGTSEPRTTPRPGG